MYLWILWYLRKYFMSTYFVMHELILQRQKTKHGTTPERDAVKIIYYRGTLTKSFLQNYQKEVGTRAIPPILEHMRSPLNTI
jgi:hypothetical protein